MAFASVIVLGMLMSVLPALAQVPGFGSCPKVNIQQDFNVTAYLGKWYEQERYFAFFEKGGECVTAVYTDEGNGTIGVKNSMVNLKNKKRTAIKGIATRDGDTTDGRLSVAFPSSGSSAGPYWVLDTDYENYSVVWSCASYGSLVNAKFSWLLTRERNPSPKVMQRMYSVLKRNKIPLWPYLRTVQTCDS